MPDTVPDGLFDVPDETDRGEREQFGSAAAPLAVRMRPASLDEVVGQDHLLQPGSPLRRLVEGSGMASAILYGPPGSGKTTLASLISQATGRRFEALSALSAGVKEVRAVIDVARRAAAHGEQTVLFIDEVHRFSKTQQDALLSAVENRIVLLVAATTENPSFSVVAPLLSRSLILQLQPLTSDDIRAVVQRAIDDARGLAGRVQVTPEAVDLLVRLAAGDARRALTALEVAAEAGERVTVEVIEQSLDKAAVRYDRDGDQHYDVISAFIKSVRGSDVDAALHYLARMLVAGEDPRFIARRLSDPGQRGHRHGRPDGAADRGRRGADGRADRHARGQADLGARHRPPGHRAEVERRHHRDRGCDAGHQRRQGRAWCRRICATATIRVPRRWATPRATSTPMTTRMALCRNNIRLTSWSASTTTGRPATGLSGKSAAGWTSCGRSSGVGAERRSQHRSHQHRQSAMTLFRRRRVCDITRGRARALISPAMRFQKSVYPCPQWLLWFVVLPGSPCSSHSASDRPASSTCRSAIRRDLSTSRSASAVTSA